MKNTKRALLLSALAIVMSISMLIGSTFAWFTDSASTAVNTIQSGTLKIDIASDEDGVESLNGKSLSFVNVDGSANILWEPNATFETTPFYIVNEGNLALKFKFDLTGVTGDAELLDVISFIAKYNDGTNDVDVLGYEVKLAPEEAFGPVVISGHMDKDAGNEYQGLKLEGLAINVVATQDTIESDSNGNDYDKDAEYPVIVENANELADAIANGKVVTLTQDIDLGKIDLTDAITKDVVINANGHKITTTESYGVEVTPGKNVTISNADVEMTKEGDYITYAAGFKIANGDYAGATITLKNCTITMANTDWAYAVTMPANVKNLNLVIDNCVLEGAIAVQCWGDNNTITITNSVLICTYTTNAMYSSCCVALQSDGSYVSENNTLVIDNCEFKYSGVDNFNSVITDVDDLGTGNTVTVTNCTYDAKVVAN